MDCPDGRWDRLTRWLGTVSSQPTDNVDLTAVEDIDGWIVACEAAGHYVSCSSGTTGKSAMLLASHKDMDWSRRDTVNVFSWGSGVKPLQDRRIMGVAPIAAVPKNSVIGDVKFDSLDQRVEPQAYFNFVQSAASGGPGLWGAMRIAVRCEQDPVTMASAVRSAVWSVNKDQPVSSISTIDDLYSQSIDHPRMASTLMGLLAGLAVVLAAVGIYGVISYSVSERKREIGIRIAVGADGHTIFRLVVGRAMSFVLGGIVVGVAGVLGLSRLIETMLYGMPPRDPMVIAGVSMLLAGTALLASWLPARRAARIDPVIALRSE